MAPPKSFFMLCLGPDFGRKLVIPEAFVVAHGLHLRRQLRLHLKSQPEERSWGVKMKKINGVFYLAGDGWSKFVEDNGILRNKVLVFHIVADATLDVSIFGHDSCLKLPSRTQTSRPAKKWRMVKKLTEHHFSYFRLKIPKDFVEATGIGMKEKIEMEDWEGRKWSMLITKWAEDNFAFGGEWKSFIKATKLEPGAILLFEYTHSDAAIKVGHLEAADGEKMLRLANPGGFLIPTLAF